MEELQRKYNHAKKIISELKRHEQFLAVQLRERDQEYNSHLQQLRERVLVLERELATTQRVAGIPVRLPGGLLSPPALLKQPPVIPRELSTDGEISEADDSSVKEDLDSAVPFHRLLDVTAGRAKAELAHKGSMMAMRSKPSSSDIVFKHSASSGADDSFVSGGFGDVSNNSSSFSREEVMDSSENSGYCNVPGNNSVSPHQAAPQQQQQQLPNRQVPNLKPNAQANPLVQEMRIRQQQQQQQQQQHMMQSQPADASYVNVPPVPAKSSPPTSNQAVRQQPQLQQQQQYPAGAVPMPGFGPSPAGSPGSGSGTLADQLKNRLEERRRSKEEVMDGSGVPDRLAADVEHAVRVANETGKTVRYHIYVF